MHLRTFRNGSGDEARLVWRLQRRLLLIDRTTSCRYWRRGRRQWCVLGSRRRRRQRNQRQCCHAYTHARTHTHAHTRTHTPWNKLMLNAQSRYEAAKWTDLLRRKSTLNW